MSNTNIRQVGRQRGTPTKWYSGCLCSFLNKSYELEKILMLSFQGRQFISHFIFRSMLFI